MHTQEDVTPIVAQYIRKHGIGFWDDLYRVVENTLPLEDVDYELLSDGSIRYQRIVRNLKSNRSLIIWNADIIQIAGGFATAAFAKDNHIAEQVQSRDGTCTVRARVQGVKKMDNRKGEKAIRAVFKELIPSLKLYPREEVYADFKKLTVHEFGVKYNFFNTLTTTAL